jgi:peptide/nickel transport system substrate-binding protein
MENGQPYDRLAVRYPTRLHPGQQLFTAFLFLNTRQPPFTSLKARQAVNYAIDRARIMHIDHDGPGEAAVTCQILPADFPGHQPYCPYTAGPKDGFWHGPDLAKARRLARQSSTTNVPVTAWEYAGKQGKEVGAYLVQLLRQLGYRATLRTPSDQSLHAAVSNSRRKVQMGPYVWAADFPTVSDFFDPALTCQSFYQDPANTLNVAEYCNPHVDKLAREAQAQQLTDPAAARKLWARIDRIVTDQAPWVPLENASPTVFVSSRAGNYQESAGYGPLLDLTWVR